MMAEIVVIGAALVLNGTVEATGIAVEAGTGKLLEAHLLLPTTDGNVDGNLLRQGVDLLLPEGIKSICPTSLREMSTACDGRCDVGMRRLFMI